MWLLEKFGTQDSNGTWKTIKKEQGTLSLQLTHNQLIVVHNAIVIDIISIPSGGKQIRGISKGSIMAVVDERPENHRRFRFKFVTNESGSGNEHCEDCKKRLQEIFSFGNPSANLAAGTHMETEDNCTVLQQQNMPTDRGPAASSTCISDSALEEALRRCLLDDNFPEIVERVEALLRLKLAASSN